MITPTIVSMGPVASRSDSHAVFDIERYENRAYVDRPDSIIQEVRLAIALDGVVCHAMTCSPWDIEELVTGFLFLSGLIENANSIVGITIDLAEGMVDVQTIACRSKDRGNEVSIIPFEEVRSMPQRAHTGGSGRSLSVITSDICIDPEDVNASIAMLENQSKLFRKTGGVHSAVLSDGKKVFAWFEDIGRHSALDKLVGWCILNEIPTNDKVLLFSGRVPYEIITKTVLLGCPVIVSPGAPTSLSIDIARTYGVTLVGFAKQGRFNVYSHVDRIAVSCQSAVVEALT